MENVTTKRNEWKNLYGIKQKDENTTLLKAQLNKKKIIVKHYKRRCKRKLLNISIKINKKMFYYCTVLRTFKSSSAIE